LPNLTLHTIDIREKDLAQQVEQFRQTLANQNYGFQKPALDLYRLLLEPVHEQIKGRTELVVVPDTVLWNLPFQALQRTEGHFLVEDLAISYAPSLAVLKQMHLRKKSEASTSGVLLAVGNPTLSKPTLHRAGIALAGEDFGPLPEAERQVKTLGLLYGPKASKIYTGSAAREDVIKAEAPKYKILQFAAHGVVNESSPLYSYVLLSKSESSPTEDGLLEAWEIMNLNLNADLVVLSACETARGRVAGGEGVMGLSWALFAAGSPASVVSLWKIESSSTTELMLDFHRRLTSVVDHNDAEHASGIANSVSRLSKAQALRLAQLSLLRTKNYSHPFFWAAFVLMGDGSLPISQ